MNENGSSKSKRVTYRAVGLTAKIVDKKEGIEEEKKTSAILGQVKFFRKQVFQI